MGPVLEFSVSSSPTEIVASIASSICSSADWEAFVCTASVATFSAA